MSGRSARRSTGSRPKACSPPDSGQRVHDRDARPHGGHFHLRSNLDLTSAQMAGTGHGDSGNVTAADYRQPPAKPRQSRPRPRCDAENVMMFSRCRRRPDPIGCDIASVDGQEPSASLDGTRKSCLRKSPNRRHRAAPAFTTPRRARPMHPAFAQSQFLPFSLELAGHPPR